MKPSAQKSSESYETENNQTDLQSDAAIPSYEDQENLRISQQNTESAAHAAPPDCLGNADSAIIIAPPKAYIFRHPICTVLTILIFVGGIAAVFAVSPWPGAAIAGSAVIFHLMCRWILDKVRHPLMLIAAAAAIGACIYLSIPKTQCCDGTMSYSSGSGTCSYHGGIAANGCKRNKKK